MGAWRASINLRACVEDQTLIVKTKVYLLETCKSLLNSRLIAFLLIETPDFN